MYHILDGLLLVLHTGAGAAAISFLLTR